MNRLLLVLSFCFIPLQSFAGDQKSDGLIVLPDQIKWETNENTWGIHHAVIYGEPSKSGIYITRTKFAANQVSKPHSHPDEGRILTVLSGVLYFAEGATFDEKALKAYPAGSVIGEHAKVPHFMATKDQSCVFQIQGVGPTAFNFVDPEAKIKK